MQDKLKISLKKGYLAGRFFGLAWAVPFSISLLGYSHPIVVHPFTSVESIYFHDLAVILLLFTEIFGPLFGLLAGFASYLINKTKEDDDKSGPGFMQLVVSGMIFWILGFPISNVNLSVTLVATVDVSFIRTYINPFLGILFAALVRYIWEQDPLPESHIQLHGSVRAITIFLVVIAQFWVSIPNVMVGMWDYIVTASFIRAMVLGSTLIFVLIKGIDVLNFPFLNNSKFQN